jgi:hypothetical protein
MTMQVQSNMPANINLNA